MNSSLHNSLKGLVMDARSRVSAEEQLVVTGIRAFSTLALSPPICLSTTIPTLSDVSGLKIDNSTFIEVNNQYVLVSVNSASRYRYPSWSLQSRSSIRFSQEHDLRWFPKPWEQYITDITNWATEPVDVPSSIVSLTNLLRHFLMIMTSSKRGFPSVQNCAAVVKFFKVVTIFGSRRTTTTIMILCMQYQCRRQIRQLWAHLRCYSIIDLDSFQTLICWNVVSIMLF